MTDGQTDRQNCYTYQYCTSVCGRMINSTTLNDLPHQHYFQLFHCSLFSPSSYWQLDKCTGCHWLHSHYTTTVPTIKQINKCISKTHIRQMQTCS